MRQPFTAFLNYLSALPARPASRRLLMAGAMLALLAGLAVLVLLQPWDSAADRLLGVMALLVIGCSALTMALNVVVGYIVLGRTGRAVDAALAFAHRFGDGDRTARMASSGHGEFARLDIGLNAMAEQVQHAHAREQERSAELARINRTLRLLLLCKEAHVQAEDEAALLETICHHVIEGGGYALAWVGLVSDGPAKADAGDAHHGLTGGVTPAAMVGDTGAHEEWDGAALQQLAWAAVVRCDSVLAQATGGLALPLLCRDEVLGALSIYVAKGMAFHAQEIALLEELTCDLACAIDRLREAALRRQALGDPATSPFFPVPSEFERLPGLSSRAVFDERLRVALRARGRDGSEAGVAVLVLGCDRYRDVCRQLGHAAGLALLGQAAGALAAAHGERTTMTYLGGAEFGIVIRQSSEMAVLAAAARQQRTLAGAGVTASIGVALYPHDGADGAALLGSAKAALASARAMGGNRLRCFAPETQQRVARLLVLEGELRGAVARQEWCTFYQPRMAPGGARINAVQALLRWRHPQRGIVAADELLALAESTGDILALGEWALRDVCRQQRAWREAGLPVPTVALALTPRQFGDDELAQRVAAALRDYDADAGCLELEIAVPDLTADWDAALPRLHALKALGVRLTLAEVGVGHVALAWLRHLPLDRLKIAAALVRDMEGERSAAAICKSIVELAHNLYLGVSADGVDTQASVDLLRHYRCDEMQGEQVAPAMPAPALGQLLHGSGQDQLEAPAQ